MAAHSSIMIAHLVHAKLGLEHPMAQDIINKYSAMADDVSFNNTTHDMLKFQKVLADLQEEMKNIS